VIRAVLFDWGDTLMQWTWDEHLIEVSHQAGLAAIGRSDLSITKHFRERFEPLFDVPGTIEEIEYPGFVRDILGDFDIEVSDEELNAFLEAEHAAWAPARALGGTTHALLDALRARDIKTGLVSNAFDPGWLLRRDLDQMGVGERLDVVVFSSEVGKRKPHPAIFQHALGELEVAPEEALFVGDRLYEDVRGAGELGMTTVQAVWFRADENPDGREPDFQAFTQMDILNIVRRLNGGR
jgi:putative hydrolase of the HAD superfamily